MDGYFFSADDSHIKREKSKARELRHSQWWKRKCSKGYCFYCKKTTPAKELTMDHFVPIARGGKTTKGNVIPSCKDCNNKKKSMMPLEWEEYLKESGFTHEEDF